ncbi:hypothetical protein ACFW2E_01000, partial [Streptomyces sp. NPDC058964]
MSAPPGPGGPAPTPTAPPAGGAPPPPQGGPGGGSGSPPPNAGGGEGGGAAQPAGAPQAPPAPDSTVGGSDSASQATTRTGQGSLRAGLLRTAWTHIGGDRIEGDKVVIHAGGEHPVVLRTLGTAEVESVRHTFRSPPRWDDIVVDAWQRRSVVLRGPGGAGKTAAAVRLLISARARDFYRLGSVADLIRLNDLKQLGGAGRLVDRPPHRGPHRRPPPGGPGARLGDARAPGGGLAGPATP